MSTFMDELINVEDLDKKNTFLHYTDKENVKKQLQELVDNFSVDDEIDMYRQDANYKSNFTISQSLEDFTEYQKKLEDLANNFNTKYHELIYQKFMNNELQKEEMQL